MDQKRIDRILEMMEEEKREKSIVVKSFPATEDWIKRFDECAKMAEEISLQMLKMDSKRDGIWSNIKEELDLYDISLSYNRKTHEIEVLEDKK